MSYRVSVSTMLAARSASVTCGSWTFLSLREISNLAFGHSSVCFGTVVPVGLET